MNDTITKNIINVFEEVKELSFDVLINNLKKKQVDYYVQEKDDIRNIIVDLRNYNKSEKGDKYIILGAHYDIFPNSQGYNDNISSVSLLLAFIDEAVKEALNKDIVVVFFDKEESGMRGSNLFAKTFKDEIEYALIFDIVGFGDYIVSCNSHNNVDLKLDKYNILALNQRLPSDNVVFDMQEIKNNLFVSLSEEDLIFLDDNKVTLNSNYTFYQSFHNGIYDNDIKLITWNTITIAYKFLKKKYIKD